MPCRKPSGTCRSGLQAGRLTLCVMAQQTLPYLTSQRLFRVAAPQPAETRHRRHCRVCVWKNGKRAKQMNMGKPWNTPGNHDRLLEALLWALVPTPGADGLLDSSNYSFRSFPSCLVKTVNFVCQSSKNRWDLEVTSGLGGADLSRNSLFPEALEFISR